MTRFWTVPGKLQTVQSVSSSSLDFRLPDESLLFLEPVREEFIADIGGGGRGVGRITGGANVGIKMGGDKGDRTRWDCCFGADLIFDFLNLGDLISVDVEDATNIWGHDSEGSLPSGKGIGLI